MYTWQLLHTWPDEKAGHFQFQKGKKEILKNFPLIDLKLFLKSISRLLWYIFLCPIKHYPSFTLFLICSYFFTQFELRCSHKVCSYKKRIYLQWKEMASEFSWLLEPVIVYRNTWLGNIIIIFVIKQNMLKMRSLRFDRAQYWYVEEYVKVARVVNMKFFLWTDFSMTW